MRAVPLVCTVAVVGCSSPIADRLSSWSEGPATSAPPPAVSICVPPFLIPDEYGRIEVSGAEPGEYVSLYYADEAGVGPCSSRFGGLCVDLADPLLFGVKGVEADGVARFQGTTPADRLPGDEIWFQALVERGVGGVDSVKADAVSAVVSAGTWDGGNCEHPAVCVGDLDADGDGAPDVCADAEDDTRRPHILLVVVDDLGWTGLSTDRTNGGHGSDFHDTPVMDTLAEQGVSFTAMYQSPNCAPGRAALMSGQSAARTGMYSNRRQVDMDAAPRTLDSAENTEGLSGSVVTIAEVLQKSGYRTGHVGKWHIGDEDYGAGPLEQGFDLNVGGTQTGRITGGSDGHFALDDGSFEDIPGLEANGVANQFVADRLTDEALAFLADDLSRPWFLHLAHFSVHRPIQAPEADLALFDGAAPGTYHSDPVFAAMMYNLDANVGRVVDWLETTEDPRFPGEMLIAHTVVMLTSDNGGTGGYEAEGIETEFEITNQIPLRGGKGMAWEGAIRVPLIVRWDAAGSAERIVDTLVQQVDLYPTIAEIADAPMGVAQPLDGVSLVPLLQEEEGTIDREHLFLHFPMYTDYPNTDAEVWRQTPVSVVHSGTWKLHYTYETEKWDLYDLSTDIGETTDVSADNPTVVQDMGTALVDWLVETGAAMPLYKDTEVEVPLPDPFAPL